MVELFEMHELERPDPGSSEVLIRVVASALSPRHANCLRTALGQTGSAVIGYDVAGDLEELGPGVIRFRIGRGRLVYT